VRSGEQLLRIGSFAAFEPGQDTSEAGPGLSFPPFPGHLT
jgi:hypothetical protein